MSKIKLAVFDMAGTTVRDVNFVHQALQAAFHQAGLHFSIEEINPYMGIPKPLAIKTLLQGRPDTAHLADDEALVGNIHEDFVREMIQFYQTSPELTEKPYASEVFTALRAQGILVALDTGFSRDIADVIIEKLNWQSLIDFSVTSDEVERGRPYPDMIYRAMQMGGIADVAEVAKIGDTSSDMEEGTSAGCRLVIGITSGAFSLQELARYPHTHLATNLREVLELIEAEE